MNDKLTPLDEKIQDAGKLAAQTALARVSRHAGMAALAAVLVPLGVLASASPAQAGYYIGPVSATIDPVTPTPAAGGLYEYSYTVHNGAEGARLTEIILPELHMGDLFVVSGTPLPIEWSASEVSPRAGGPTFYTAGLTPAYDLVLTGGEGGIRAGSSLTFNLYSHFSGTVNAQVETVFAGGEGPTYFVDPNVPNSVVAAVPEPASLALLGAGALMLAGARTRKRD